MKTCLSAFLGKSIESVPCWCSLQSVLVCGWLLNTITINGCDQIVSRCFWNASTVWLSTLKKFARLDLAHEISSLTLQRVWHTFCQTKYYNFSSAEYFMSEYGEYVVKKLQFPKEAGNYFFLYLPSQKFLVCPLITAWTRGESRLRAFYCIKAILNCFSLLKSKWLQIALLS